MEQYKLVLEGAKQLKWEPGKIRSIQDDEIIVKTIAGAISIGPSYHSIMDPMLRIRILFIQEKLDMKVMVK
ncbi:hypothetical protein HFP68_00165 [Bacillus sp. CB28A.1]